MSGAIGGFGIEMMLRILSDIIKTPELKDDSVYEIHIKQDGLDGWYPFPDDWIGFWKDTEEGIKSGTLRKRDKRSATRKVLDDFNDSIWREANKKWLEEQKQKDIETLKEVEQIIKKKS